MRLKSLVFLVVFMLIFACSALPLPAELPLNRPEGFAVPYSLNSGISNKQTLIARDEEQWRKAWSELHARRKPVPPLPKIDFDTSMVVIFALGAQKSGGYSVQITRAVRTGENLKLTVEVRRPSPGCIVTAAITAPADVALLPMTKKPVVVEEISVVVDC